MKNHLSLCFQLLLLLVVLNLNLQAGYSNSADGKKKKPNVIFILVDDQGYYDLGCYGGDEFETPQIDQMAREGVRLTDYYAAAPICSPSRAGILTGCYPKRIGMATWVQRADSLIGIHPDELTIAELFQEHGYKTACIGKWHLGAKKPFLPQAQGFEYHYGLLHNLDPVEAIHFREKGGVPMVRQGEVIKRPADANELTKLYTDETIRYISENKERPFFIYLPHTMLHNPLGATEPFKGKSKMGPYGDAIMEMDFSVGRILNTLKALEIDDHTIVIYASDNGRGPGRNASQPIQGRKLSTWEGGIRVPGIIWGAGIRQGFESSQVVNAMDWYPTLATFAGIKVPETRVIDGRDISSLLSGKSNVIIPAIKNESLNGKLPLNRPWNPPLEWEDVISQEDYERAFFYHGSEGALAAVRLDQWKLHLNPNLTLYDLSKDPGEKKPARNRMARKLRGMAVLFMEEMARDARQVGQVGQVNRHMVKQSTTDKVSLSPQKKTENTDVTSKPKPSKLAQTQLPKERFSKLRIFNDVTYVTYGDRTLEMDVYRPKRDGELPAIICIHGGGWAKGHRKHHAQLAMALAGHGFVTATISYRLSGEKPFPAQIQDCKAAVKYLRARNRRYGIDADKIGAMGLSAGGHLTALLATSGGVDELDGGKKTIHAHTHIQAAVAMGAQTDLESERIALVSSEDPKKIWRQFLSGSQKENPAHYRLASPLFHLDAKDPPVAIMTGEHDHESTHAEKFRTKMKALGIDTRLKVIPGAPHAFLRKQVWFDTAVDEAVAFFEEHLKGKK